MKIFLFLLIFSVFLNNVFSQIDTTKIIKCDDGEWTFTVNPDYITKNIVVANNRIAY